MDVFLYFDIEYYLSFELFTFQSKCPIDAVDSSGRTALHHAGKYLNNLRHNYTEGLLYRASPFWEERGNISGEIKFKIKLNLDKSSVIFGIKRLNLFFFPPPQQPVGTSRLFSFCVN